MGVQRPKKPVPGNPVPTNFKVRDIHQGTHNCALLVEYPDACNYEGMKILVFNTLAGEVLKLDALDPHFDTTSALVARFVPTDAGWELAIKLVLYLDEFGL